MTDLRLLTVSLTKHGAHKVAGVIKQFPIDEVLQRAPANGADRSQARKNLSALSDETLPPVWNHAKALGPAAIDGLVLIAIVFSHHQLVQAMREAADRRGPTGMIERDKQLVGKEYTNFVRILDQLGYGAPGTDSVSFDLSGLFRIPGLGPLAGELLRLKLLTARWDGANDLVAELTRLNLDQVFGVPADRLRAWLKPVEPDASTDDTSLLEDDRRFFEDDATEAAPQPFAFSPGHRERTTTPSKRSGSASVEAEQLHNDLQNRLYLHLVQQLGADYVGTENPTGGGTAIDLVTREGGVITFYEIKTGPTVRACIRQALPQLMEYAYWPADRRAHELVVVSHLPVTSDATKYVSHLRAEFNLPLSYRQFDRVANMLR